MAKRMTVAEKEYNATIESWVREKQARIEECRSVAKQARIIAAENDKQARLHARALNRVALNHARWLKGIGAE